MIAGSRPPKHINAFNKNVINKLQDQRNMVLKASNPPSTKKMKGSQVLQTKQKARIERFGTNMRQTKIWHNLKLLMAF